MAQPALDLVIAALEKIRETNDRAPRASITALARLQGADSVTASLCEARASPTGRRLQLAPNKAELLEPIRERVRVCTKCAHLACSRTQTVFGVGNPDADLMFIGEAPGMDEDQQGEPFVGRAGQLLTKIIKAMNFAREDVYIANILKCRPDTPPGSFGNRPPTPAEMQTCRPYLVEQINIIQPSVLVALGAVAVEGLLGMRSTMRETRGLPAVCAIPNGLDLAVRAAGERQTHDHRAHFSARDFHCPLQGRGAGNLQKRERARADQCR